MKTLYFDIHISAPREKVYRVMLDKESFKKWTAEFSPTSRYLGTWEKGSKMLFLADESDGKECGMVSRIKDNHPNHFVSIEHIGLYEEGKEIFKGPKVDSYSGALEEYTFEENENGTHLKIRMDAIPEWEDYFLETWPKALSRLKQIVEDS